MGNRVNKSIVLLIAAYLANQERGVENKPGNYQQEKDNAKNQQSDFAGVKQNPANVERNSECYETSAQRAEEGYRFTTTTYCHKRDCNARRQKAESSKQTTKSKSSRPVTHCLLPTAYCLLPTAHCSRLGCFLQLGNLRARSPLYLLFADESDSLGETKHL